MNSKYHANGAQAFLFPMPIFASTGLSTPLPHVQGPRRHLRPFHTLGRRKRCCAMPSKTKRHIIRLITSVSAVSNPPKSWETGKGAALLIVDHGSKRAKANTTLEDVAQTLQTRTSVPVYFAHMELATPTIAEGIQSCVENGAKHIIVVPFFLAPGRHVASDIPKMAAEAAQEYPGVSYEVRSPIGTHPGIIELILDRAGLSTDDS